MSGLEPAGRLTYDDEQHAYRWAEAELIARNPRAKGTRVKGISTCAKIPVDTFTLEAWDRRQVLIGAALDPNIVENVATHIDNDRRIDAAVADAKNMAGAHRKADRGTQAHRALEIVLLDQPEKLLTDQQIRDARALRNTLERYELEPTQWVERIVWYPEQRVAGRFDAILRDRHGRLVMSDLKTGLNAVRYPQSTCVQLALYRNAPWYAEALEVDGDKTTVTGWGRLPAELEKEIGYVIQLEPDAEIGTLYELDLSHGWAGAQMALDVVAWRKAYDYGSGLASLIEPPSGPAGAPSWAAMIEAAQTRTEVRLIWAQAKHRGELDAVLRGLATARAQLLPEES